MFCITLHSRFDGVVVSVFVIGPKVRIFKASLGDEYLRERKIRSTPFFGGEVDISVLCRKMLLHV
jgi:hypothetical protein